MKPKVLIIFTDAAELGPRFGIGKMVYKGDLAAEIRLRWGLPKLVLSFVFYRELWFATDRKKRSRRREIQANLGAAVHCPLGAMLTLFLSFTHHSSLITHH